MAMRPGRIDCENCMGLAKRSRGVALATMRRRMARQLKCKGEGVVATHVSPNSAYAKHLRSRSGNKGSNEFSLRFQTHIHARRAILKWKNRELTDFVPCVSAKEGAGLWDCVEGKFYPNKGGAAFNTP